jgi:hypothetical protein
MIPGIEEHYQRIADALVATLPEGWRSVTVTAVFYADSISWYPESVTASGKLESVDCNRDLRWAFQDFRQAFREAGKLAWGEVVFTMHADGTINVQFKYENCDENGNRIWDAEEWSRRHDEWVRRLSSG